MLYKCISKILADRLKLCLPKLNSCNQSAFVEGRKIREDILLVQEVVKDNGNGKGKSRCTIKLDIIKAFDYVNWEFMINIPKDVGFP